MKNDRSDARLRKRNIRFALLAIVVCYLAGYLIYRQSHTEIWEKDGKTYVIFDTMAAYYAFRPLSRIDDALTGTGAHIGPHR